jgi:hypothetical protein
MEDSAGEHYCAKSGLSREQVVPMLIACEKPVMIQELMSINRYFHAGNPGAVL